MPVSGEVRISQAALRRLATSTESPVVRDSARRAIRTQTMARANLRRNGSIRTGRLVNSVRIKMVKDEKGVRFEVGSDVKYASYVEFGTGPHLILPRNKKALWWKGADHPVRRVNHPGSKAKPWLRPAIAAAKGSR
jgi:hypothetical protein